MSWRRLFQSPPPSTAWHLDDGMVVVARRDRKRQIQLRAAALPAGAVEVGQIGLQGVDSAALRQVIEPLQQGTGRSRPALLIPTGWVRTHLLEFEHLPRRQMEMDEVVRWRLKKLLPVHPTELRIAAVPQPAVDGRRHVLCMSALEKPLAELEGVFGGFSAQPGQVTPLLFALADGTLALPAATRLVIQQEPGFLSLLLLAGGQPRLLRTKLLPPTGDIAQVVVRELQMTLVYIRDNLSLPDPLEVMVSADTPEMEDTLRSWWAPHQDASVMPQFAHAHLTEPELGRRIGNGRLAPLVALLSGASP